MITSGDKGARLRQACHDKTRADLEWDRLLEAIADRCAGELGVRAARELTFADSAGDVRTRLQEASEAFDMLALGDGLPGGGAPPVGASVERLRAGGALGPAELQRIAALLGAARVLRRYLQLRRDKVPALLAVCGTDPQLDAIETEVAQCFDEDGTLSDRASPRLAELRAERNAARERLMRKLQDVMQRYESALQDDFITEREGRFVLPVRSDSHERFTGIVHGTSASGHTLYMEPRAVIPLGNRLKVIDSEIEREENAVYARLSASISEFIESVSAAERALAIAELRMATARLAADIELAFPAVVDDCVLDLVQARHPLLQLDGVPVVPGNIRAEAGKAVVISGPNAGGKTVVLKTLGLAALMLRAGLPVACSATSTVGVFEFVASDMGDEQSIARNLSTFSAHVKNLSSILDDVFQGALVLLDEIATGTDPREGEALACAVLDGLCARGGAVVCTTHYEGLKALAIGDPRFQNASVGFDFATMSPTFELVRGIPGASSALAIARRFGMPSRVIDRAEQFLGSGERSFEQQVRALEDERRALQVARSAAEREAQEVSRVRAQLKAELEAAHSRDRRIVGKETEALLGAVRRAREELRAAEQKLRTRKLDENLIGEVRKVVHRVAQQVAIGGQLEPPQEPDPAMLGRRLEARELARGMRVYVPKIRGEAQVVDLLSDGQVRVAAGSVKLIVSALELRTTEGAPRETQARAVRLPPLDAAADPDVPIQTTENRCDLRGLRVDEAVAMAEQFLDRGLNEGRRVAFLIHGYGTGALRDAIRTALRASAYVVRFRPGEPNEGGDGVTVVWLR